MQPLTLDQLTALRQFAADLGRSWKRELNLAWVTGNYPATRANTAELQRIRNTFGPSWLVRFRFPLSTIN